MKAVEDKEIPLSRIEDAVKRARDLKKRFIGEKYQPVDAAMATEIVGCDEHQKVLSLITPIQKKAVQ